MSIFAETFIMASDNGTFLVNHQSQSVTSLSGIDDVGVLAFDWLTDTLYWTNSKLNTVRSKPTLCYFFANFADNWSNELHCVLFGVRVSGGCASYLVDIA